MGDRNSALPNKRLAIPPVIRLNWLGHHALWWHAGGCPGGRDADEQGRLRPPSPKTETHCRVTVPSWSVLCHPVASWRPFVLHLAPWDLASWRPLATHGLLCGFSALHHPGVYSALLYQMVGGLFLLPSFSDTWHLLSEQREVEVQFTLPLLSTGGDNTLPTPLNGLSSPQWFETPKFPHSRWVCTLGFSPFVHYPCTYHVA